MKSLAMLVFLWIHGVMGMPCQGAAKSRLVANLEALGIVAGP
jgi:hypothetical protein